MRNTQQGFALIELLLVLLLFSGLITLQGYLQRQQQRQLMDLQTSKAALSQAQLLATIYPLSPEPWGVNLPQAYHETVVNEGECQNKRSNSKREAGCCITMAVCMVMAVNIN